MPKVREALYLNIMKILQKAMEAEEYLKSAAVIVWRAVFTIGKSRDSVEGAFATIKDRKETTVIIDQSKADGADFIEAEKGWKLLTFDAKLPFGLTGFLARVSQALAEEGISIFVVSTYSTDHVLVKEEHLEKALEKLEGLGCRIEKK
jgi:hypothetical protein